MKKKLHKCPICGTKNMSEIGAYEICGVCGWEDDPAQRKDKNLSGGANKLSLNEAKKNYNANN